MPTSVTPAFTRLDRAKSTARYRPPKGMDAAEHVRNRAALAVEIAGRALTDDTRAVFYDALDSITANLRKLDEEGLPKT